MVINAERPALRRFYGEPALLSFGFRSCFLPAVLGAAATLLLFGCGGPYPSNDPIPSGLELPTVSPYAPYRIEIVGQAAYDGAGHSVSGAGDTNGDGTDDVIIGAFGSNVAYVVYGEERVVTTIDVDGSGGIAPDYKIRLKIIGEVASDRAGWSVSAAGDVNGDGIDDVIVGAPRNDAGGNDAGAAYVVYGTKVERSTVDLGVFAGSGPSNTVGFRMVGEAALDAASSSVSGAGDVNGDGTDDVIVGARLNDAGGDASGVAYVIFAFKHADTPNIDLGDLAGPMPNNNIGFKITGEPDHNLAGRSVSGAGDINADGYDDVIVGAPDFIAQVVGDPSAGTTAGAAYVVYGVEHANTANVDLAVLAGPKPDTTIGFKIIGQSVLNNAGYAVSGAGDVNADGYDDVIVGAPQNGTGGLFPGYAFPGAAYVVYGKREFDANVELDVLDWPDPDNTIGFKITVKQDLDRVGQSVSDAGDFNRDGVDDVIVGAPTSDALGTDSGAAYVVYDQTGGQSNVYLGPVGTGRHRIVGKGADDGAGFSVSGAGDFSGDGHDDVIVGAFRGTVTNPAPGAAYVIVKRTPELVPPPTMVPSSP